MPTRRQFIQYTALLAGMTSLAALLPPLLFASEGLRSRVIPASGESLPVIGLGTSRTHNVGPDDGQLRPLLEVLRVFVEGGARVIDTAPSYGRAESVSGELVQRLGVRDQVFLASKVSSSGRERGLAQIEASFRALQTEVIDLIQVHNLQDTRTQGSSGGCRLRRRLGRTGLVPRR